MTSGVILYGPPAAGKDTITRALTEIDSRFTPFRRLKVGAGRTTGYRMASQADLALLRERGELIYANDRYEATYAVDRPGLDEVVDCGGYPVVHLGQVSGIAAVIAEYPIDWQVVGLWCPRDESAQRLSGRGDDMSAQRLAAWDATLTDFRSADPALFTLIVNTASISADRAARMVASCCL